jgi:hypothetical protein
MLTVAKVERRAEKADEVSPTKRLIKLPQTSHDTVT